MLSWHNSLCSDIPHNYASIWVKPILRTCAKLKRGAEVVVFFQDSEVAIGALLVKFYADHIL